MSNAFKNVAKLRDSVAASPYGGTAGSDAVALGFTAGAMQQSKQSGTSGTDFALQYFRRNADHSGGAAGFVSSCLRVETYTNAGTTNYEWAFTAKLDNSTAAGQNVAAYSQGIKRSTGPTWASVMESIDATGTANPATGLVGVEVDIRANGTDNSTQRVGMDLVASRQLVAGVPTGAAMQAGYGIRFQHGGDASAAFVVGIDTTLAVFAQAAMKLAVNQPIAFNAAATKQLSHDGTGLKFSQDGGASLTVRLNDAGNIQIASNQVIGARIGGYTNPFTGATNKPTAYDTATITLPQLAERVAALQASLTAHGLIGA
jgi:hypothetical protein